MQKPQETWVWSLGAEDLLEKETATHFSILASKIPWMEEIGGLQTMGSQRVGHDWVTNTLTQDHLSFRMWQLQSAGFTESFKNNTHVFWWQAWSPSLFYPGLTLGWEDLLEKETATFSSILAGKIPWMEDPGRLQFMGSQTVQHYWATSLKKLSDLDKIQARASLRPQSFFSVLSPNDLLNVVFHLQIFTDFPAVN